ncbi:hypothetical protein [Tsukamurella tyrosinosolvens]|uniref:hypothetical protein n=1 Tax=Tsukamurella tyrosinosolvens TaxID=57704 RepID=UPI0007B27A60|nr:hypothetical protein [Tsukamurella tyrosinosolvens]KZL97727.1 hypothetical protein AXX05_01930 [Tsukamurella tyrosinosolvens]
MKLTPISVSDSTPAAQANLEALGVRFIWHDDLNPEFQYDCATHTLYMWAAKVTVWDSGRIVCGLPEFLRTPGYEHAHGTVLGHLEDIWRGDQIPSTAAGWGRVRKTAKRGQGGFTEHLYVCPGGCDAVEAVKVAVAPLYHSTARERLVSLVDAQ